MCVKGDEGSMTFGTLSGQWARGREGTRALPSSAFGTFSPRATRGEG